MEGVWQGYFEQAATSGSVGYIPYIFLLVISSDIDGVFLISSTEMVAK